MTYSKQQEYNHKESKRLYTKETLEEISKYPFAVMPERKITKETCKKFGVRMQVSQVDGKTPVAYYFPYYDARDKLSGYKKRDLTLDKNEKFHFTTIGKVGVECKLFGQQYAEKIDRKKKALYFVEGEHDFLALYQAGVEAVEGTKWEGMEPFVVSLSCGTANAVEAVVHNIDFVKAFDKIVLGFDADSATPQEVQKGFKRGKECTEDVAAALLSDNIYWVQYPAEYKDPSDMYVAGDGDELQRLFTFEAKKFVAEKIITSSQITLDEILEPRVEGVYIHELPRLMEKIHGLRKRELVVLTGPVGVGKSTFTSAFAYGLGALDQRVGMVFLEETYKETLQRMIAKRVNINHNLMKHDPLKVATREDIAAAKEWCDERYVFMKHFGSMHIKQFMNKIKTMVHMQKCDFILVDHLSMLVSGIETENERKMLDIAMTELAAFCASTDVGIIAVSHLNRSIAEDYKPKKGEEDKPFWVNTRKESMRGSAALEQLSWIVLGLDAEILPNRERGRARISVLKNRPWSYLGEADTVMMNDRTGHLEDALHRELW